MRRVIVYTTFIALNFSVIYPQSQVKEIVKDAQSNTIEEVAAIMQTPDSTLQSYTLNEVVVKGERPRVKVENGALTYDISRLTDNKIINNAYESILQLPGIHEQDGKLSLTGTNELTVVLNGKPTTMDADQLSNVLKNTPVSRVSKAEVMYNAPARYRARGAVINIILKEETTETTNLQGEVNTAYQQKHYGNENAGVNLSFSSKKVFADMLYSLNYSKTRSGLDLYSQHLFENTIYDIEQINRGYSKSLKHNVRFGLNYSFTPKNKISFAYTGSLSPDKKSEQQSSGNFSDSYTRNDSKENMNNFTLGYQSGFGLTTGVDYTHYDSPATQAFNNIDENHNLLKFISKSNQKINRWKAYIGQIHNLAKDFSLNYGMEFTYVNDNSHQTYFSQEGKDMSSSNSQSDINEYTYNIYTGVDRKIGNFSLSFSLAGEYYKMGYAGKWAIYPTAQVNHVSAQGHIFQLSFSANKSYPNYWLSLNNIGYLNGYMEIHGNPYLKPAEKYSTRLNYILKNRYIFSAYHNSINNYFIQLPYQSPEELILIYQTLNFNSKQEIGISVVAPFRLFDFWDSNITIDGNYNKEKCVDFHGLRFNRSKWRIFSRIDNTFILSSVPDIKLELTGMYMSPLLQGIYDITEMWQTDAGIKWTFAHKNAELRLKGTDLFNKFIPDLKVHYDTQNLNVFPNRDNRSITLSFNYKFGNYKKKASKSIDTSRFGH